MGLLVLSWSLSCSLPHGQLCLALLLSLSEENGEKSFFLDISLGVCFPTGFSGGSHDKESAYNAGDPGSMPGLGRSPGEGIGTPLQYMPGKSHGRSEPGGLQSIGSLGVGQD